MTFLFIQIPENVKVHLNHLAPQLRLSVTEITDLLKSLSNVVNDQDFVKQVLAINDLITVISADN